MPLLMLNQTFRLALMRVLICFVLTDPCGLGVFQAIAAEKWNTANLRGKEADVGALNRLAESLVDTSVSPSDEDDLRETIARCLEILEITKDASCSIAANKVIYLSYWHLGELETSKRFFDDYISRATSISFPTNATRDDDGDARRKRAARLYHEEIKRLYAANDHRGVIVLADEALARYHDTNEAWMSQRLAAKSCQIERRFEDAVARLKTAAHGANDISIAANSFRESVIMALRAGRADWTLSIINDEGSRFDSDEMRAFSIYHKGLAYGIEGEHSYPKASREFSRLIKEYPKSHFVPAATAKKAEISKSLYDMLLID